MLKSAENKSKPCALMAKCSRWLPLTHICCFFLLNDNPYPANLSGIRIWNNSTYTCLDIRAFTNKFRKALNLLYNLFGLPNFGPKLQLVSETLVRFLKTGYSVTFGIISIALLSRELFLRKHRPGNDRQIFVCFLVSIASHMN